MKNNFKMLIVFSPIFVAYTKIIVRYDFVAPLIAAADVHGTRSLSLS